MTTVWDNLIRVLHLNQPFSCLGANICFRSITFWVSWSVLPIFVNLISQGYLGGIYQFRFDTGVTWIWVTGPEWPQFNVDNPHHWREMSLRLRPRDQTALFCSGRACNLQDWRRPVRSGVQPGAHWWLSLSFVRSGHCNSFPRVRLLTLTTNLQVFYSLGPLPSASLDLSHLWLLSYSQNEAEAIRSLIWKFEGDLAQFAQGAWCTYGIGLNR